MSNGICFLAAVVSVLAFAPAASGADWLFVGDGDWQALGANPVVMRQGAGEGVATALLSGSETGGAVYRCMVEPAPGAKSAGMWFAASEDARQGYILTLGSGDKAMGVVLRDAGGKVLWQDKYAPWSYYTPWLLEAVVEEGRIRVQALAWDRKTLIAQSDWIEAPQAAQGLIGLYAEGAIARFYRWERAGTPSMPIVADSPTRLRLINDDNSPWRVVGQGDWGWVSADHKVLRQRGDIERGTAINTALGGSEGTWRCRVSVEKGTCGSGMAIQASEALDKGFLVWLGGTYGAGSLMLYRLPGECLWSSPQEKWFYDKEYVIEGTIRDGKVSARMLEADGETVVAESPEQDLMDAEKGVAGNIGFQVWRGKASFWDFSDSTRAASVASVEPEKMDSSLGGAWRTDGDWQWADGKAAVLRVAAGTGVATAVNAELKGTKGTYKASVIPGEGAKSVSLLFQVSSELGQGFEIRMGEGLLLRTLGGRDLWEKKDFNWTPGQAYTIEGVVVTDRVAARVRDTAGAVLAQSEECYVSDTNNTREGGLGFRCEGGGAEFTEWSVSADK